MTERIMSVVACGVDGSGHAMAAVRFAAYLAHACGARLAVISVNPLSPGGGHPDTRAWTETEQDALLKAAAHEARSFGCAVQCVATQGRDPADALIAAAKELGAGHIVVGTGDRKGPGEWFMGSVAKAVAARALVSVTITR